MNRVFKIGFGITIIVVALVYWTFQSLEGNEVYYVTVEEIINNPSLENAKRIKLGGVVKENSINLKSPMSVEFQLMQDDNFITVEYEGIIPDMFKDASEVIVEGKYIDSKFVADNLIAKCASKYETNFEHEDNPQNTTS